LDKELHPDRAREIQAWLDRCQQVRHCDKCLRQISDLNTIKTALVSQAPPELPTYVHARIMDKVKSDPIITTNRRLSVWKTIPVAAAVLLSFYVGSLVSAKTFSTGQTASVQTTAKQSSSEVFTLGENSLLTVVDDWSTP